MGGRDAGEHRQGLPAAGLRADLLAALVEHLDLRAAEQVDAWRHERHGVPPPPRTV
ncbi:MAG: hypothetical protein HIU86_14085 [Acidobacteria bacterium]|nr:hypothetical protein [Acidobacteriota bacterium]